MTRSLTACGHGAIEIAWGGLAKRKGENIMAIIGTFTKDGTGFTGTIETLGLKAKLTFKRQEKRSDNAPDYRVLHMTEAFTSDIGAAWTKTSKKKGTEYLSIRIDDPSFSTPLDCRLVKTGAEHGYSLIWERER
jgi:uncharacterized protein (DUF736 family)